MFKSRQFYHQHIRKAIVAFGMIFNNININRVDGNNVTQQVIRVPLAYSTKQKFLSRIAQIPDTESRGEAAIVLPRMGFEIQQFEYDPARKISPIQKNKAIIDNANSNYVSRTYVSTPYNMTLSLYVFAKNQEDGLQIIEQILPFFNPDFNVTVNELPELGIKRDIKITLDGIDYDDAYEGAFADRQSIIWTLNFTMRLNFYGYISDQGVIREAIANAYAESNLENISNSKSYSKITASITTQTATAVAFVESNAVNRISITYEGAGYVNVPKVTISGGGGSGAEATATINTDGTIKTIDITSVGSGYTSTPTVTIEDPPNTVAEPTPADPYRFILQFEDIYEE